MSPRMAGKRVWSDCLQSLEKRRGAREQTPARHGQEGYLGGRGVTRLGADPFLQTIFRVQRRETISSSVFRQFVVNIAISS